MFHLTNLVEYIYAWFLYCIVGEGVTERDLRDHLGNWNHSSMLGAQGQTLASIRCFSNVAVVSRTRDSHLVFEKLMDGSSEEFRVLNPTQGRDEGRIPLHLRMNGGHGTAVWVEDLFRNLPVRKRVFRPDSALTALKEFVSAMSLLHHSVTWTLRTGASAVSRVVLQLPAQESVAQRLLQLYRPSIAQSMQVGCYTVHTVRYRTVVCILQSTLTLSRWCRAQRVPSLCQGCCRRRYLNAARPAPIRSAS